MTDFDPGDVHPITRMSQGYADLAAGTEAARAVEAEREAAPSRKEAPAEDPKPEPDLSMIGRVVGPAPSEDPSFAQEVRSSALIRAGYEDPDTRSRAAEIERRNRPVGD